MVNCEGCFFGDLKVCLWFHFLNVGLVASALPADLASSAPSFQINKLRKMQLLLPKKVSLLCQDSYMFNV